jgi:hypothetical protein
LTQLLERRKDDPALGVPQHNNKRRTKTSRREFDAANVRWRDDVACDADYKQVAKALVENNLGRHPGIGTSEYDGKRFLSRRKLHPALRARDRVARFDVGYKAAIAFLEPIECLLR